MKWLKIRQSFLLIIGGMFLFLSCKETSINEPLEEGTEPPGKVKNVQVENLPGGAELTYTLPDDEDLLYVRAEYTLDTGKEMEVKASYYDNSLKIEGYADSTSQEVTLYAVNRNEIESEPVSVTINPKRSKIWDVYNSITARAAFGGINVEAENPERNDIAILVMLKDDFGEWEIHPQSIYTSTDEINANLREGLDTLRQDFAITVRDRWLNYTDTLVTELKPLYEAPIPKSGYSGYPLEGDAPHHPSNSLNNLWDGNLMHWPGVYLTNRDYQPSEPHTLTIDVGMETKLSRIVIWDYPEYYTGGRIYYYLGCPKRFEIWGASDPTIEDPENWMEQDNWHKLGTYEETKPSGLPYGEQSNEDYQTANAGFSWDFDIAAPEVRYLRIRNLENWNGFTHIAISEVQVYGDPTP
ncbi:DUF4959 domain-containing protein [Aliifodinibius sp. S!AR15-10]|uniref:DUF4959 domain-containing protein n=1 Tax=Aliifodinibius sp. S!AR15-10 TaxID=2950437 RepID=UPI00285EFFF1|nr:DUF4959 domain-containing protein [Aliifodinibius sp. S!AR15-10]MDR8392777.1 DUF4959 domain-containing protein [Aliifodinibius sp. S!AR15-10]